MADDVRMIEKVMRSGVETCFDCPRCGGREFGSYLAEPDENGRRVWMRAHHGRSCGLPNFSIDDDYKHFTVDGVRLPSQEEYEARVYTHRDSPDAKVNVGTLIYSLRRDD